MTDPTPDDLATLARAMGYTVTLDDSGGYGVVRVMTERTVMPTYEIGSGDDIRRQVVRSVFCPHLDAAQAWEVMAWLMRRNCIAVHGMPHCIAKGTVCVEGPVDDDGEIAEHDGTAAGIRRAVVEAAIRVAKG